MADSEFVRYVVEALQPLGPVSARRMFGGYGVFLDGMMFGLIAADQLYLKVDDGNRADYEARGLPPFTYSGRGRRVRMSYHEAPGESVDDPEVLCVWAGAAHAAALRANRKRAPGPGAR